ncbi:MAG TPA: hypothetical protein H9716_13055 [Candidatus Enterocloster faecavium]|uniref:Esterase n=1 Tax=Candidatus Enterocloster faecavium TaxID=2838560 RepID=A0A9D2RMG7_9FIRM|nr:hypothetical protein [Candidatus Enterocloster faecavium]
MMAVVPLEKHPGKQYPVLWLLAPAGMDHTAWQRHTDVEGMAERLGIIVVMPDMKLSYGVDMVHGFAYGQMLTEELPKMVGDYFPADLSRQMIAGTMEGGYGAFYAALRKPGQYRFAACYSCGSLTDEIFEGREQKQIEHAFGTREFRETSANRYDLKGRLKDCSGEQSFSLMYSKKDRFAGSAEQLAEAMKGFPHCKIVKSEADRPLGWNDWKLQLEKDLKENMGKE